MPAIDSSEYLYDVWRLEDGLPQITAWSVVQDAQGYLWIGTEEGVARFDGLDFTVFETSGRPELPDNVFEAIVPDDDGLWLGTRGGLVRWDGDRFTAYTTADGLVDNLIHALHLDRRGRLWIGTDGGISRLDGNAFTSYTSWDGLPSDTVRAFAEDRRGRIWIGTKGGLARYDEAAEEGTGFTLYTSRDGLLDEQIWSLYADRENRLWIGTLKGVQLLEEGVFRIPAPLAPLRNTQVFLVTEDRRGRLWLGTRDGLFRFADGELSHHGPAADEPLSHVMALWEDHEESLWAGTRFGGLVRLRERRIIPLGKPEGLIHDVVWSILEDRSGHVWVSSDGGVDRLAPDGGITSFTLADGLPAPDMGALFEDRRGDLWIGTFNEGLVSVRGDELRVFTEADGFPPVVTRDFLEDRQGDLWIATQGGLVRRRGELFQVFGPEDGLPDEDVRGLHQDGDNTLWILTLGGLARWEPGGMPPIRLVPGLFPDRLKSMHGDADGTLWIGTWNDGLLRFRDGELTSFTVADGIYDRRIHQILDDGQGWLWMTSNRGIFRVRKAELEAFAAGRATAVTSLVYNESDGMRSRECNGSTQPAGTQTRDGRLWFPTIRGVAILDPTLLTDRSAAPPVVIEEVLADGQRLDPESAAELPPGTRGLSFRYTALSFARPESTRFRYWLEGYDDTWIEAGSRRSVQYTNLAPRTYRFRVVARGGDGVWNEMGDVFELRIAPAMVQRPAFWFFSALGLTLAIWAAHRWKVRSLIRTSQELYRMKTELEAKNVEVKAKNTELERFTYTVSHDLKSPLVTIQGFLGLLVKDLDAGARDRVSSDVEHIRVAARKMHALLAELLELARIGRVVHPSEVVDLGELTREAVELAAGPIAERGVEVTIAPGLPRVFGDRIRLLEVIQNLVENAVKYMGDEVSPRIEIHGFQHDGEVVCRVRDNGLGIDPCYRERVFGLFEQLDPRIEGTGIGLALAKRIVEFHGGRIWVESEGPSKGSTFSFALPVDSTRPVNGDRAEPRPANSLQNPTPLR